MRHLTMLCILLLGLAFSLPSPAAERIFGLSWQATPAQLRARGMHLTLRKTDGRLSMYETRQVPRTLSDADTYLLVFDRDAGLVKIIMVSRNFTGAHASDEARKRFEQLDALLRERGYSALANQQVKQLKPRAGQDFFVCLSMPSCGTWKSAYRKGHVLVSMQLRGLPDGAGFLVMNFEEQPQFAQALAKNRKPTAAEKDAQAF